MNSPSHPDNGAEGTLPRRTSYLLGMAADKAELTAWRRMPRLGPDIGCADLVTKFLFPGQGGD